MSVSAYGFYAYLLALAVLLCHYGSEYFANSSLPSRALKGKEEIRLPQPRSSFKFSDSVQVMGLHPTTPLLALQEWMWESESDDYSALELHQSTKSGASLLATTDGQFCGSF